MELLLTEQDKIDLKKLHGQTKEKRHADRIKIITMLDKGFTQIQISELLMLDEDTISNWSRKFSESRTIGEFLNFQYTGYAGRLSKEQIITIRQYIVENFIISPEALRFHKNGGTLLVNPEVSESVLKKEKAYHSLAL